MNPAVSRQMANVAPAESAGASYRHWARRRAIRWTLMLSGLVGLLAVAFALSLGVGSVTIPLDQVLVILGGGTPVRETWVDIVRDFRLPKALTALLAGAALAVSGAHMQTLFRNPLASPSTLGVNAGASLGVAIVALTSAYAGVNMPWLGAALDSLIALDIGRALAAGLGAAAVMVLLLFAARNMDTMTLLILGVMFSYATNAVVTLLIYFAVSEQMQAYVFWTFGSFSGVTWSQLPVLASFIALGLLVSLGLLKALNALLLGETYARSMGVAVSRVRATVIVCASALAGGVTAFCGPVAFLGVATPHLCRALIGTSDHRLLVPAAALMGAALALIADVIAQMPGRAGVLPLNAVTAFIGAPVVIWVIARRRRGAGGGL
ncbi:MAG: iron chelate uptake ABC transporter family permease subunit [Candidatus Roseilinea sp.]|uniref:iron chelate uptake ABC transporter family permease subunit n=1 Tax=Candidatus Roseilinea sp. TaxID=2838777 RepID=UPI00404A199F